MFFVSDSLVDTPFSRRVEKLIYGPEETLLWEFSDKTSSIYKNDPIAILNSNVKETFHFSAQIPEDYKLREMFSSTIEKIFKEEEISFSRIHRFRSNILTKKDESYLGTHHTPHVDVPKPGFLSFLYYVDSSDGDTIFFDQHYNPDMDETKLTEKSRLSPLAGRFIVFESNRYHAASSPLLNPTRPVVNIVLEL